jgi:hypothetical protein
MSQYTKRSLIIDEKILLAAAVLPTDGFTAEDLVVATFKRFPKDFCLMGFPDYPDSNKILTQITTSRRGLKKRGWLAQIGTKRYQITGEGRRHLEILRPEREREGIHVPDRDIADMLKHWIRSDAFQKFKLGKIEEVSEREALAYWRLSSGASAERTNRLLAIADSTTGLLLASIQAGQQTQIHHTNSIPIAEAQQLVDLHSLLKERFGDAIKFLQNQRR